MTIGICGSGIMGRGIALACIQNGRPAILYDVNADALDAARQYIDKQLAKGVQRGKLSEADAEQAKKITTYSADLVDFAPCGMVIEAIVEDLGVKQRLFSDLEDIVANDAILATNTSSIAVTSIAVALRHPERFIGMHFFNPAHIMKLVEVIKGAKTSQATVETTVQLAKDLKKSPAVAKDVPGFIVNRVARNFYNEALRICTENAATVAQVDTIMKSAGFKMGPFELMDLIGVDTNFAITQSVWAQYYYEPRFAPALMQHEYVLANLHGRKTGRGFHDYAEE